MKNIFKKITNKESPIVVIGLGYVGLPLAALLAKKYKVIGFDINSKRINDLLQGIDHTSEIEHKEDLINPNLNFTDDPSFIKKSQFIIISVPTPVDDFKKPDLSPLLSASRAVGKHLNKGTTIVFESTVYPGCTENECRVAIESETKLRFRVDFNLAYSPERINPGDKKHTVENIKKVVSASSEEALDLVSEIYGSVIKGGIYKAPSIAIAEAAKVIENTQRDLNIAFVNELSVIFDRVGIDTQEVLSCARTKWNFLDFSPGLVGGHCIGVDPYYLTYLAEGVGINPQVILAGRRINDGMGTFIAQKTLKLILSQQKSVDSVITVALCGVTFKENVPDIRNSKAMDVVSSLEDFGVRVLCVDPICNPDEFEENYKRSIHQWNDLPPCDAVIMAVKHNDFINDFPLEKISSKLKVNSKVIVDIKGFYDKKIAEQLGLTMWRL